MGAAITRSDRGPVSLESTDRAFMINAPHPHDAATGFLSMPLWPVADAAREGIVMVDTTQTIVAANTAALKMFGWERSQIVGQPLGRLIPERYRERHLRHVQAFDRSGMTEQQVIRREPITGMRSDGQEFPVEASLSRVELSDDGVQRSYFAVVLRDLSVERALRHQVATLTQRFRAVIDLTPVAMWIVEDELLSFANRSAFDLFGVSQEKALVGRSVYSLFDAAVHAELRAHVAQVLAGQTPEPIASAQVLRPDGQLREVEIASAALPDHGRTVVQMVITDITRRQRQLRAQRKHRLALRQLSASVVEAREEERRRIARELHDELGQRLTALKMELSSLKHAGTAPAAGEHVAGMLEMIDETVAAVRRISADLRPLMLDDLGLNAAIEALAREAARRMDIEITGRLGHEDPPVNSSTAIALYRMVQEALTNVGRHARATDVAIEMQTAGGELVLTVRDNGVGFPAGALQHEGRFGLLGMRERTVALGGRLEVDNPPGGGGRITIRLPLPPTPANPAAT
jgi:two-component system sensor histidine kinase UhpB